MPLHNGFWLAGLARLTGEIHYAMDGLLQSGFLFRWRPCWGLQLLFAFLCSLSRQRQSKAGQNQAKT